MIIYKKNFWNKKYKEKTTRKNKKIIKQKKNIREILEITKEEIKKLKMI